MATPDGQASIRLQLSGVDFQSIYDALSRFGTYLNEDVALEPACHCFELLVATCRCLLPPNHGLTRIALHQLVFAYGALERFEDAGATITGELQMLEKRLGADHPDLADVLDTLSNILYLLNRMPEAKAAEERAARLRRTSTVPAVTGQDEVLPAKLSGTLSLAHVADLLAIMADYNRECLGEKQADSGCQLLSTRLALARAAFKEDASEVERCWLDLLAALHKHPNKAKMVPRSKAFIEERLARLEPLLGNDKTKLFDTLLHAADHQRSIASDLKSGDAASQAVALRDGYLARAEEGCMALAEWHDAAGRQSESDTALGRAAAVAALRRKGQSK